MGYYVESDIDLGGEYTLEFYDPNENTRQVFYQNHDFMPHAPVFVQNGERIALWGNPDREDLRHNRLEVIERDGTIVDQLDIDGPPIIRAVNDGFLYTIYIDEGVGVYKGR
jgi:hypothetical protein